MYVTFSQIFCSWSDDNVRNGVLPSYRMPKSVGKREQLNFGLTATLSRRIVLEPQPLEPVTWVCSERNEDDIDCPTPQFNLRCGEPIGRRLRIFLGDVHGNECAPPAGIESPVLTLRNAQVSGQVDNPGWTLQREGGAWFLTAGRLKGPDGSILHVIVRDQQNKYKSALLVVNLLAVRITLTLG
jgi:hypothetical protein